MFKLTETQKTLNEYYFDEVYHADTNPLVDVFQSILRMHGAGGKFVESIIQSRYQLNEVDGIHDFDGQTQSGRKVEMKMETINSTAKMAALGSWAQQRESNEKWKGDIYREERPYVINIGTCDETGKCIYVTCLDTAKLPRDSRFFQELDKVAPRVRFSHFSEHTDAYRLLFLNHGLLNHKRDRFNNDFAKELERMASENATQDLDILMA